MHGVDWPAMRKKYAALLARRRGPQRSQPRDPVDVERALGRPSPRWRRRSARDAEDRARRPARRRLQRREWTLSLQEGLRRSQLDSAAARAADRARRERPRRRVSARRARAGRASARQRLQLLREHRRQDRRDHRRPEPRWHRLADRAGRAGRERERRCAIATGSRATCEKWTPRPGAASPTSTCPNTAEPGYTYFKRYFYPQTHKDAVIVDERFNGGGQIADYYIDLLRRPLISYWAMRYGDDLKTPAASIQGPKVMIIDETAGSGGDLLPWMFRKFERRHHRRTADVGWPRRRRSASRR